jgi:hypothetical protein
MLWDVGTLQKIDDDSRIGFLSILETRFGFVIMIYHIFSVLTVSHISVTSIWFDHSVVLLDILT